MCESENFCRLEKYFICTDFFFLLFSQFSFFVFNFSTFEAELADVIPVVKTSVAGTRIVGRLCAGGSC